jgi:alpha-beta hydrolase superfamily lysophospholipase
MTDHHQGRVKTTDQLDLVWQSWTPESPRGVIVIIHGLAEHSGRYQETAKFLSENGWAVYACDLRAHGLSPDPPKADRVHVNRFEDYFRDVDALTGLARERHPELPIYLLGHSMGGLISIRYSLEKPAGLAGVIISSPALGTHPEFKPPFLLKLMVSILSRLAPRLLVASDLDTQAISRDPAVVKAYIDDPLVSQKVSTRWYNEIMKSMRKAHEGAASLRIPMLLMQSGADRLVDPAAPGRWAKAAPDGLVDLVVWDGLYHEMLNEPEKDKVRARLLEWLDARVPGNTEPAA